MEPTLEEIIDLAMRRTRAENARQLADALGMTDIDRARRVRRWLTGENQPSFRYTILLLEAAGLLRRPDKHDRIC